MSAEKFIAGLELQELLRDKDSGLPLALGTVEFFEDANRTIQKPVFEFTGSPSNPAFTELPNPVPVNGAGMPIDPTGNPIAIYYFPFEADGVTPQLYFLEVRNSGGVLQNTRENWPPGEVSAVGGEVDKNLIPNPQFDIFNTSSKDRKRIIMGTEATNIAYGLWQFYLSPASTSEITVSFDDFGLQPTPDDAPIHALNVEVTSNDVSDTVRDLALAFEPVNVFSSDINKFTWSFWGKSNLASNVTLTMLIRKNYGPTGSPITTTVITTFVLEPSYKQFFIPFVFGDDDGKTRDGRGDVQIRLRLPFSVVSHFSVTNFILEEGEIDTPIFPPTPIGEVISESLPNVFLDPNPDGSDLFLPIRVTNRGLEYDKTEIGKIYPVFRDELVGELLCKGASFFTDDYSSDGIPFSRLQAVIDTRFGTGLDFVTTNGAEQGRMIFTLNEHNSPLPTAPVDVSGVLTAVTPTHTTLENAEALAGVAFSTTVCNVALIGKGFGSLAGLVFGSSPPEGDTAPNIIITNDYSGNDLWDPFNDTLGNSRPIYKITVNALPAISSFFRFATQTPAAQQFFVWFQIDGVGIQPVPAPPAGLPILINLRSTDTNIQICIKIAYALNSFGVYDLEMKDAAGIVQSGFWEFDTASQNYLVWYNKDGGGTEPVVAGRRPIEVKITTGQTVDQVVTETANAINNFKFSVPDMRGLFLRGFDETEIFDPQALNERIFLHQQDLPSRDLGTIQWPIIQSHAHEVVNRELIATLPATRAKTNAIVSGMQDNYLTPFATDNQYFTVFTGRRDTRPWNMAVNYVIKY